MCRRVCFRPKDCRWEKVRFRVALWGEWVVGWAVWFGRHVTVTKEKQRLRLRARLSLFPARSLAEAAHHHRSNPEDVTHETLSTLFDERQKKLDTKSKTAPNNKIS